MTNEFDGLVQIGGLGAAAEKFRGIAQLGAVTYAQDATWAYTAFAGYSRILGTSGDSPLVRRPFGDPDQLQFGIKIDYSFSMPALF